MKRAAFFELRHDYYGRPFEDGILRALTAAGFAVDLFAPGGALPQPIYPDSVRRLDIEYRRRWLQSHLRPSFWNDYDLFLGTADVPMAFTGAFSFFARKPSVTACDEVFTGGFEGAAFGLWKHLARRAMHRADFTIITDPARIPLQNEYANLSRDHEFFGQPSCYAWDYAGPSREEARAKLGIGADEFVLSFTGTFTANNGAHWVVRLLDQLPDVRLLVQTGGHAEPATAALLTRDPRILHLPDRLGWTESMALTVAADVGLVLYLSEKSAFQHMGVSSQKLCTSLWLGNPVIATRQPSFAFIADFHCGTMIDGEHELVDAVRRVRADRAAYARNTRRTIDEYIQPKEKLAALTARFAQL